MLEEDEIDIQSKSMRTVASTVQTHEVACPRMDFLGNAIHVYVLTVEYARLHNSVQNL